MIVDGAERRETILHEAKQKAFALGLELIDDEGLANEVMGLAEWPVVLIGEIDSAFMDVPPEILQTSMRTHQKYFALRHPEVAAERPSKGLANRFVVVANMIAADGGKQIVAGNERVLRARLSDAKFFWEQDKKRTLESRVADLKDIVFHAKLGTQLERVERIEALAGEIAKIIGADVRESEARGLPREGRPRTTGVVGEFPELQGVMGRYYALHDGESQTKSPMPFATTTGRSVPTTTCRQRPVSIASRSPTRWIACGLLWHRRKTDRIRRSLCVTPRRTWNYPHPHRKQSSASLTRGVQGVGHLHVVERAQRS